MGRAGPGAHRHPLRARAGPRHPSRPGPSRSSRRCGRRARRRGRAHVRRRRVRRRRATRPASDRSSRCESFLGFNGEDFVPVDDAPAGHGRRRRRRGRERHPAGGCRGRLGRRVGLLVRPRRRTSCRSWSPTVGSPRATTRSRSAPASADALGVGVGDTVELSGTEGSGQVRGERDRLRARRAPQRLRRGGMGRRRLSTTSSSAPASSSTTSTSPCATGSRSGRRWPRASGAACGAALGDPALADEAVLVSPRPRRLAELEQVRRLPTVPRRPSWPCSPSGRSVTPWPPPCAGAATTSPSCAPSASRGGHCRVMVVTQASLLAGFGLVSACLLGLALGRTLWRTVADNTPVAYVAAGAPSGCSSSSLPCRC